MTRRSTVSRAFFPAALLLLTALLLVGTFFQLMVRSYLTDQSLSRLEQDGRAIATLSAAYSAEENTDPREYMVNLTVASEVSGADVMIFDSQGRLLLCSEHPFGCEHRGRQISSDYLHRVSTEGIARDEGVFSGLYNDARYVVSLPIVDGRSGQFLGMVTVSESTAGTEAILDRLQELFLFISLGAMLAALIFMTFFARRQSKPLRVMAKTASDFGHGALDARVPTSDSYTLELEELALAFNNMADSIQKGEYQRREFVANVSHELRSSITSIQGFAQGILDGTIPKGEQEKYLSIITDETHRLSKLIHSLLSLSRIENEEMPLHCTSFDINERIRLAIIARMNELEEKELEIETEFASDPCFVHADADQIQQVLINLLDNAVKFTPKGGRIRFSSRLESNTLFLCIQDDGQGILPEDAPHIFDRFYKADKAHTAGKGTGLGLAICRRIMERHGQSIRLLPSDQGAAFEITLATGKENSRHAD